MRPVRAIEAAAAAALAVAAAAAAVAAAVAAAPPHLLAVLKALEMEAEDAGQPMEGELLGRLLQLAAGAAPAPLGGGHALGPRKGAEARGEA